jgi:glycosyltransferase involved in cell wall biosynthesis
MRFVSYYSRAVSDASGVTAALWAWANALAAAGEEVLVVHAGGRRRSPDPVLGVTGVPDVAVRHLGSRRPTYIPVGLRRILRRGDVLLLHEGWVLSNHVAAAIALASRVPYVVVPHGVYEPGILASLKGPRRVRTALERWMLEHALAVHVFWDSERGLVTALAPRARIIVVPTGFAAVDEVWTGGGGYLAWLGRFDPVHKGLDLLLQGLASIEPEARPRLRMHGPDYNGGLAVTRALVEGLGLGPWVQLGGPVQGDEKRDFLVRADGYVHPSRWESHSIALLETLALGLPSVVSDAIHIAPALRAADAVIAAPPTPDGLAAGLRELPAAAGRLRGRGPAFVRERLAWPLVTRRFVEGVRDLLDAKAEGSARPIS